VRIEKQLLARCKCGAVLGHKKCDIKSITWTYSKGVHFVNAGFHQHPRPGHILHISKDEQVRFEAIVNTHPSVGPLALIVGVPGVNGPGESVADISDVFVNAGRVGKERLKIKKGGQVGGGDAFISAFMKFSQEYPGFVIYSQLNIVTVISVQSSLMRTEMVKERLLDGPINGLVNDAAHGWWKERTSLLIMSSSYCPDLLCWVPGVISYTNGASAEHFKYHNLVVSIPVILGIEVGDETAGRNRHRGAKRQHWDFPETITPDSEEAAIEFNIIYDLVGFVLVNTQGTHFIARYATHDRTKIYTYDGMRHNGYPVHSLEMTFDTHMAGIKPKIPKGFIIWEAIYSLRGGLTAQEKFYQMRIKKYAAQYNLSFSEVTLDKLPTVSYHQAGFREMDKKDRVWLLRPERKGTTEYISNPIPSLPLAPDGPESEEETSVHPASQVSLPDSDFALNCRCGAVSNANIAYHQDDGEAVQCNECRDWSHVACQQDGRVSSLGKDEPFLCDSCDLEAIKRLLPSRGSVTRASERK